MTKRVRIGMLTPSSNTVLEPVSSAMVAGVPGVSMHFSRFRVTEISASAEALGQFEAAPMLAAASLLADAGVDVICWNGTSAGWLGLDADRTLCSAIEQRTRIPATSSVIALVDILRQTGITEFGLVSPYVDEIQSRIIANFAGEGFRCRAERHVGEFRNAAFAEISPQTLADLVRNVAKETPETIAIFCTNLRGAPLVPALEAELGIPIYDTVATAVWGSLRLTGIAPGSVKGWGRLFSEIK